MTDIQEQSMWATYYEKAAGWGASWLLLRALELYGDDYSQPRYAVDLGCGEGSDTRKRWI
jgi:hypothetical protein